MASNYTTNYKLPLWEGGDNFLREEFNEAHEKVDAAMAEVKNDAAVAVDQVAASISDLIVTGTYVGTASGSDTTKQTIELGFQPRFLFIRNTNYKGSTSVSDNWTPSQLAFAVPGHGCFLRGSLEVVSITATGFTVGGYGASYNNADCVYAYLAIR